MSDMEMENFYRENLEEDIVFYLSEQRNISPEQAMHLYYNSKLSENINAGKYGIQYLDYTILVDLLEEELK